MFYRTFVTSRLLIVVQIISQFIGRAESSTGPRNGATSACDDLLGRLTTGKDQMASGSQPNVVEFPEDVEMADDNDYGSC